MNQIVTTVRRGLRVAVAGGLLAAGLQFAVTAPATAQDVSVSRVGYTCKATNPTINQSLQGPQQFYVTAKTTLPDQVSSGTTVPPTKAELTLVLPPKLVNRLMKNMKVTRVKGSSTSDVVLQAVAPGGAVLENKSEPVKDLVVQDWVNLVADSEVEIVANGNVGAVAVPNVPGNDGLIYVQMPPTFVLHSVMDPPVLDSIAEADLNCTRDESTRASRVLGTIPIGNGCSETECPLPAEGSTGPVTTPTTGPGTGTDPDVIDPTDPDAETPIDGGTDYGSATGGNGSGSGSGSGYVDAASYETSELPATGSSLGLGMFGALAAAAALRVALLVRQRRKSVA